MKEVIINWIGFNCNFTATYEIVERVVGEKYGDVLKSEDLL